MPDRALDLPEHAARMKAARAALGLTQDELAEKIGAPTHEALSRAETGARKLPERYVVELASLAGEDPDYFRLAKADGPEWAGVARQLADLEAWRASVEDRLADLVERLSAGRRSESR